MNFELRKPCPKCPFRSDIRSYLTQGRVEGILKSLDRSTFACHQTTVESDDGEDMIENSDSQMCAGAMILCEKTGNVGQMMRIAERLKVYDHTKLDMESPVFDSFEDMIDAQPGDDE